MCLSVCLSVCLTVNRITKKDYTDDIIAKNFTKLCGWLDIFQGPIDHILSLVIVLGLVLGLNGDDVI